MANHEKSCILMKIQENSIKINRFRKAGWLGRRIWLVKSPKILFSKIFFLEILENLRKSAQLLHGPALGRARTGSAQLRTPKKRLQDPNLGESFLLLGWMDSKPLISDVFEFLSVFNSGTTRCRA